mmetsp:Transcript_123615/g.242522  ORF Transcript_123615/g.242522 Transcript_123615/m.242522 type:complete len:267 (-) Transcript_123615:144-944(-)
MSITSNSRAMVKKVLVLGGTGFVGNTFVNRAVKENFQVVSLSRRGALSDSADSKVTWVKGDATDFSSIERVVAEHGPFHACVHTLGVLFDGQSGLKGMNVYVSGSRSLVDENTTYDMVTRNTAFNAIEAISKQPKMEGFPERIPFVFTSAAEAGWTFNAPVQWLQRYLIAKRAVESKLLESKDTLRPIIMRPSVIWSWKHPEKVIAASPFYVGSALRIPIIDRPIQVEVLTDAMISAINSDDEEGVKRYMDFDRLAAHLESSDKSK